MRFIPEDVTNRLEAEWLQITNPNGATKSASDRQLHPIDHIRKMAAVAIATTNLNVSDGMLKLMG